MEETKPMTQQDAQDLKNFIEESFKNFGLAKTQYDLSGGLANIHSEIGSIRREIGKIHSEIASIQRMTQWFKGIIMVMVSMLSIIATLALV